MPKADRQELWERAHLKTVEQMVFIGLWPDEVPLPNQYLRILGNGAAF